MKLTMMSREWMIGWLVLQAWGAAMGAVVLVEDGASQARIVIPSETIPSERHAAEELQAYVEEMSGVRLPIVSGASGPRANDILLGNNIHLEEVLDSRDPESERGMIDIRKLGPDGFVLRTVGERLIIAGGRPRGTLNGVYTLLEEELGVRWFTPEVEVVPERKRLVVPALNRTVVPSLEYREVFWTETMRDADFAARHRLNGQHYALGEKHGGRFASYYPFVHSFDALIPPNLFERHPEYFPLIDGERRGGYVQRCLTNPEVVKMAIGQVRQWIKEHPEATILSVSQNDCIQNCRCDTCKALDEAEGGPIGSLLAFVNQIASALERDYPRIKIDTLAYQYTRHAPKTIRPHRNVIVRLCSIECCFAHPLETCSSEENRRFREDIVAWQPVAPSLYVWDYTPNFAHYQQPFPNFDVLQANVQFFVRHGVKGLFEQGNYSRGGGGEMGPLRSYLLAKLLWNPNTDLARHIQEFVDGYYGKAGPKVLEFLDRTHRPVRGTEVHAHIYDRPVAPYLEKGVMAEADRLLAEAEAMVEGEPAQFRVQVARLPVWYVQIAAEHVTGEAKAALLRRFLEVARRAGITDIREGGSLEDWARQQGGP